MTTCQKTFSEPAQSHPIKYTPDDFQLNISLQPKTSQYFTHIMALATKLIQYKDMFNCTCMGLHSGNFLNLTQYNTTFLTAMIDTQLWNNKICWTLAGYSLTRPIVRPHCQNRQHSKICLNFFHFFFHIFSPTLNSKHI